MDSIHQTYKKFTKKEFNKRTTYENVFVILYEQPSSRNSDKLLYTEYFNRQGIWYTIDCGVYRGKPAMLQDWFIDIAANTESIRRSRAKIQSIHASEVAEGNVKVADTLLSSAQVAEWRAKIAEGKGTHIYREKTDTIPMFD